MPLLPGRAAETSNMLTGKRNRQTGNRNRLTGAPKSADRQENDLTGARQYNFQFQGTQTQPREDKILRVDYNLSSKDTLFVRLIQDAFENSGYGAIPFEPGVAARSLVEGALA